jgi:long-chain fatty acid transport protein
MRLGLALLTLAVLPEQALAGGYMYADSGIVANGRGGAVVAGVDDQFAQYYNPAGLMRIERPTLNAGWSGVTQNVTFTRVDETGAQLTPATNESPPFSVPQLGFAAPLIKDKMAFAFGFYSPFAPGYKYDPDGEQRYSMIDTLIWKFSVGPSIAVRPIKQLSFGAGFQWNVLRVGEQLKVTTSGSPDPLGDVLVDAQVVDLFTPSFNAGMLIEPVEQVSIGLAVEPPIHFDARGTATLDFTGNGLEAVLDQTVWEDDDIGLAIDLPLVLRAGVAVRPIERLELEFDYVFEQWSVLEDIIVSDIDVTITGSALNISEEVDSELALPAGLRNSSSFRFGAEFDALDILAVRAGGFYETAAMPVESLSVALVDAPKFQIGTGASLYAGGHLRFDASLSTVFYQKQEITDSEVTQVNVYGSDGAVVGNGTLEASGWVVGAQASVMFGKPPDKE